MCGVQKRLREKVTGVPPAAQERLRLSWEPHRLRAVALKNPSTEAARGLRKSNITLSHIKPAVILQDDGWFRLSCFYPSIFVGV